MSSWVSGLKHGMTGVALVGLLLADAFTFLMWASPGLFSVVFMGTLGLGFIPVFLIGNLALYAHPVVLAGVARRMGASRGAAALMIVVGVGVIATTPGLLSWLAWKGEHLRQGVPSEVGEATVQAPRALVLDRDDRDYQDRVMTDRPRCDALCLWLLRSGAVDALEVRTSGGTVPSTVYRRVEVSPCPEWAGDPLPSEMDYYRKEGPCVVAEPGGALVDAPVLRWSRRLAPWSVAPNHLYVTVAEMGPADAPTWRRVGAETPRMIAPSVLFVVPGPSTVSAPMAFGLARWPFGRQSLVDLLRDDLGYQLDDDVRPHDIQEWWRAP